MNKPNLLISACRLGIACRYHGRSVPSRKLVRALRSEYNLVAVCPEQLAGLPTPREPVDLTLSGSSGQLRPTRATGRRTGKSYTKVYQRGAKDAALVGIEASVVGAVLVEGSPSCGRNGFFTHALAACGIPVVYPWCSG